MKTNKFAHGMVVGIFLFLAFAIQSQDKKTKPVVRPVVSDLMKKDSILSDSLLPDSVLAVKKEVQELEKEFDKLLDNGKLHLKTETKFNAQLKSQGVDLDKIQKNIPLVSEIPTPSITSEQPAYPDSLVIKHGPVKRKFRLFKWHDQ